MNVTAQLPARVAWVDFLKTFGITLVFIGHAEHLPDVAKAYIYTFHMPLFFFISGYLNKRKNINVPFGEYVARFARSLLVPYFVLGGLAYGFWVVESLILAEANTSLWKPLVGMLYSAGGKYELLHATALWFLPSLFLAHILHYLILKISGNQLRRYMIAVFSVSCCGFLYAVLSDWRLPWNLDSSVVGLLFYACGLLFREGMPNFKLSSKQSSLFVGILMLSAHAVLFVFFKEKVDLRNCNFGFPPVYVLSTLLAVYGWVNLFSGVENTRLTVFISRNTLAIFVFQHAFTIVWYFLLIKTGIEPISRNLLFVIIYTITGVIALSFMGEILTKFTPWAMGVRKKK